MTKSTSSSSARTPASSCARAGWKRTSEWRSAGSDSAFAARIRSADSLEARSDSLAMKRQPKVAAPSSG